MPKRSVPSSQEITENTDSRNHLNTLPHQISSQPLRFDNQQVYAKRLQVSIAETVAALRDSLSQFMPDCPYRDFYLWSLSDTNSQRESWLQVTGLSQIAQLTVNLVGDLVDDVQWKWLANFTAPFNLYLVYEVVSDNLAIGLNNPSGDRSNAERKTLLHEFNRAVCGNLGSPDTRGEIELQTLQSVAQSISSFTQSLSPGKQAGVVRAYLQQHPAISMKQLEHSIWQLLVANFNAAMATAQHTESFQAGEIIRHGLLQRYETVDALLLEERLSLEQLTIYSAYAILLVPTIAYYVEGLARATNLRDALQITIETGTLSEALLLTAILVRLLNDFGTELLLQSADDRKAIIEHLYEHVGRRGSSRQTLNEVLLRAAGESSALLTRLKKDIQHGELNLGLWYLSNVTPISDALMLFAHRLEYFSEQYAIRYAQLKSLLATITEQVGNNSLSLVIARCVQFHEVLYRNPYSEPEGEYAV